MVALCDHERFLVFPKGVFPRVVMLRNLWQSMHGQFTV